MSEPNSFRTESEFFSQTEPKHNQNLKKKLLSTSLTITHHLYLTDAALSLEWHVCVIDQFIQGHLVLTTLAWKHTSGDPSGLTWNYCGITLLYNFRTALLYMVLSVTMTRIAASLGFEVNWQKTKLQALGCREDMPLTI